MRYLSLALALQVHAVDLFHEVQLRVVREQFLVFAKVPVWGGAKEPPIDFQLRIPQSRALLD
ncbi:hypothetical protein SMC1_03945 [Candidatus Cryosericum septentrionale]|uniref:Uncharacterized protein n=1 Tax=Candidatus Cryosericum septentrionale TaxID=2290913 RepID=A0A398DP40_9BACT|nr:hypothetical protein SMC1_03945 [Candidatus Cryosericum septentrionale]